MSTWTHMKVRIVEEGFLVQDGRGVPHAVTHDLPIALGEEVFTTAESYEETLRTLTGCGVLGSRFVQ